MAYPNVIKNLAMVPRNILVGGLLFLGLVASIGTLFYLEERSRYRGEVEASLKSIARLKTSQISYWRQVHLNEAREISASQNFVEEIDVWLRSQANPTPPDRILHRLQEIQACYNYSEIKLLDVKGLVKLSLRGRPEDPPGDVSRAWLEAMKEHRPVLSELYRHGLNDEVSISVIAPLHLGMAAEAAPIGAVVLTSRANDYLFPLVQSWPIPSRSAETLLIRREENDVLFLNALRHRTDTALRLRLPLTDSDLPAAKALRGIRGVVTGLDYREVPVLAVAEPIPGSNWVMIAKMDEDEAFAEWRLRAAFILSLTIGLLVLTVLTGLIFWHRHLRIRTEIMAQAERKRLETERRHSIILRSIGDGVITTDANGNVEFLNPVAEELTGWRLTEAKDQPLETVFPIFNETSRQTVENPVKHVLRDGLVVGLANHTLLINRAGREIPIADSGAPIRGADGALTGVVLVFRDQTEERNYQREREILLEQLNERIKELTCLHRLAQIIEREEGNLDEILPQATALLPDAFYRPEQTAARLVVGEKVFLAGAFREAEVRLETPLTVRGREVGKVSVACMGAELANGWDPFLPEERDLLRTFAERINITLEHNAVLTALRESESINRTSFALAAIGMAHVGLDGRWLRVNDRLCAILGYTREELQQLTFQEITHPDDLAISLANARRLTNGDIASYSIEKRYLRKDHTPVWIELNASLTHDEQGIPRFFISTFQDIDWRKKMEARALHFNTVLRAILNISQSVLTIATRQELIETVCRSLTVPNGFDNVWVTLLASDGSVAQTAWAGGGIDYSGLLAASNQAVQPNCWQKALSTQATVFLQPDRDCLSCEMNSKYAGRFVMARALAYDGENFGVVVAAAPEIWMNQEEDQALFEELVSDLSIVLYKQEIDDRRWELQRQLSTLLDNLSGIAYRCVNDRDWTMLFLSHGVKDLTGHAAEDLLHNRVISYSQIIHPEDRPRVWEEIQTAIATDRHFVVEYRIVCADGTIKWVWEKGRAVFGPQDTTPALEGFITDLTERKRVEESLRLKNIVFDASLAAQGMADADGVLTDVNAAFLRMWGCEDKAEVLGFRVADMFEDPEEAKSVFATLQTTGSWQGEFRAKRRDGVTFFSHGFASMIYDAAGRPIGYQSTNLDVTQLRETEAKLTRLNEELEHRVHVRTAQLEAANKELESFSYSVSHDLRAPLRAMDGFGAILLEDYAAALDAGGRDYLNRIRQASANMGHLIDDLLNLSRLTRQDMNEREVDLSDLASQVLAELRGENPNRQVAVWIQPGLKAIGDAGLIRVVLHNLMGNAWKFTAPRECAKIEFGLCDRAPSGFESHCHGQSIYYVKDNGVGFDMAYAAKLFNPFQRLHSVRDFAGTGIGLATVHRVVTRHGGAVWAESVEGCGATFYFSLPEWRSVAKDFSPTAPKE